MSNSRKRAGASVDGGGDNAKEEDATTNSVPTNRQRIMGSHNIGSARSRADAASSNFQRETMLRKNKAYQGLNRGMADTIRDLMLPPPTDTDDPAVITLPLLNEYQRQSTVIEEKYGGIPCEVVSMGNNEANQLGFHTATIEGIVPPTPPTLVEGGLGNQIRSIGAGGIHSVALSNAGIPYSWGCGDDGTLGRLVTKGEKEGNPTAITGFVRYDEGGVGVEEDGEIVQIAVGDTSTLFLSLSGSVYQCGMYKDMDSGKFSDINGPEGSPLGCNATPVHVFQMPGKVLSIHAKGSVNAAILEDRRVVTWGKHSPRSMPIVECILLFDYFLT